MSGQSGGGSGAKEIQIQHRLNSMSKKVDKHQVLEGEMFRLSRQQRWQSFHYVARQTCQNTEGQCRQNFLEEDQHCQTLQAQLVMAKITGNFKRGNERPTPNPNPLSEGSKPMTPRILNEIYRC